VTVAEVRMSPSSNQSLGPKGRSEALRQVESEARVTPPVPMEESFEHLSLGAGSTGIVELGRGRHGREAMRRFLFVFDLCLVWGSAGLATLLPAYVKSANGGIREPIFPPGSAGFLLFFSVLIVLFARIYGLYEVPWKKRLKSDLGLLAKCVSFAALITGTCNYLYHVRVAPTLSIVLTIIASWISLTVWRTFIRSQSISGLTDIRNVLIVGCGTNGELLRRHLEQNPDIGYVFKGYIDRRQASRPPDPLRNKEEADILGPAEHLPSIVRKHFIDEIFISVPSDRHLVKEVARHATAVGLNVRVVPDLYDGWANNQPIEYVGHFPTMTLNQLSIPSFQLIVKRLVDIAVSATLLMLLMPFLLIIAAIIKLDSKGPVLYGSLRVGKKGETFFCYKFRTMVAEADTLRGHLEHLNQRDGILFKIDRDPRITRVGKILRKFSLDEWPQLWNVLRQDMSLVGPRPSVPSEYTQYQLKHLRRLDVTPGVTGLWQVTARRNPSFESYIALDKEYVNNWSLWLDCRILLRTIGVVLSGTGQ
jgi:exopolysaccharide biosynthesis polyprenyl glycosylphosphotransferase